MRPFFLFLLILYATASSAQYPFEKKPAIRYKSYKNWKVQSTDPEHLDYNVTIPGFFKDKQSLAFQVTHVDYADTFSIRLYKNNKLLQRFIENFDIGGLTGPEPPSAFTEDINGDGLMDLKVLLPNNACCGAYNYYSQVLYFFQKKDGSFTRIGFQDLMWDYKNRPERDFDGDGNFEIITQTFKRHENHSYLVYNLYNFDGNQLVNVNSKANYPIMIQLLYRQNYAITNKISRTAMKQFASALPDDYDKK